MGESRIFIKVEGGLVQAIYSDVEVAVTICDHDVAECDPDGAIWEYALDGVGKDEVDKALQEAEAKIKEMKGE